MVRKNGRRNNGELCISDGSGLYCRHGGPIDVLGRGYYRGEALKMFIVFSADGVPWYRTSDEVEADYLAFCVGGFVVESGAY